MNTGLINWNGSLTGLSITRAEVTGNIYGTLAQIDIKQEYRNSGDKEADTVYRFTLPPCACIIGFNAVKAKEKLESFIMEKEEAGRACEKPPGLSESLSSAESGEPVIFEFSVGLLSPGEKVSIHISYIQELEFCHSRLSIVIPALWAPSCLSDSSTELSDEIGDLKPKASLKISLDLLRRISDCHSPSHAVNVDMHKESGAVVSLREEYPQMDRDFMLVCTCHEEESTGGVLCSSGKGGGTVYLSFVPAFPLAEETGARDYIFLADVSDAMTAEGLTQVKYALNTILRNLSEIDTFSIAAFGSSLSPFSRNGSLPFAQASLDRAAEWIERLTPTAGRADIFKAIRYALPPGNNRKSTIYILTAGRIDNQDEPINYIYDNIGRNRVFVLGTDAFSNDCMLNRMADAGRGRYERVYPGERIDDSAIRQFTRITSGVAENVHLDWNGITADYLFPDRIPNVYDLEPVSVLAQISEPIDGKIVMRGNTGRGIFHLALDASDIRIDGRSDFLQKVLTKRRIEYLEGILAYTDPSKYETVRSEIIKLSKNHGVPSSLTTFVTVNTRPGTIPGPVLPRQVQATKPEGEPAQRVYASLQADALQTEDSPRDALAMLTLWNIHRILARNQQANGAFSPDSRDNLLTKVETTALVLTAFTAGKENIRFYSRQLQKAVKYLTERIINGRITPEQSRNSEALLKSVLALKLCLASNILNTAAENWILQCLEDIRAASEASEPLVGCRNEILELIDGTGWRQEHTIRRITAVPGDPEVLRERINLSSGESRAVPALARLGIYMALTQ